jgi:transcriptional regulator with GAF, ATPase, and Fis domain
MLSEAVRGPYPSDPDDAEHGVLRRQVDRYERRLLIEALRRNEWNQTKTAKDLGMTRHGLVKMIKPHGLSRPETAS